MSTKNGDTDQGSKEPVLLGLVAVSLFALFLATTLARVIIGWGNEWWSTAWEAAGGLFVIAVLAYLSWGGFDKIVGKGGDKPSQGLTAAEIAGRSGIAFLFLALVGNFAAAIWTLSSLTFDIARNLVGAGFITCFVIYVVLRLRQRGQRITRE